MSKKTHYPTNDAQLYGRLLSYAFQYKWSLVLSFLGFVVYSLGNVLLADLTQFLLDSLGETTQIGIGFVARTAHWFWPPGDLDPVHYARIAVPARDNQAVRAHRSPMLTFLIKRFRDDHQMVARWPPIQ